MTRHFIASSTESALRLAAADEALELCGITQLAGRQAGELPTGQRRLVELARCLAGPFDVLLLDEPTSGLDRAESDRFCDVLRRVVDDRGCGVLLVEHDMSIVTQLCTHIYVVDFGTVIFDGSPAGAVADSRVRAAYLGPSKAVRGPQE